MREKSLLPNLLAFGVIGVFIFFAALNYIENDLIDDFCNKVGYNIGVKGSFDYGTTFNVEEGYIKCCHQIYVGHEKVAVCNIYKKE